MYSEERTERSMTGWEVEIVERTSTEEERTSVERTSVEIVESSSRVEGTEETELGGMGIVVVLASIVKSPPALVDAASSFLPQERGFQEAVAIGVEEKRRECAWKPRRRDVESITWGCGWESAEGGREATGHRSEGEREIERVTVRIRE